ncbi:MAG: matrixin family metalloprotease [Acidobacteriota bacterium]|nr:matrixin family metalloprotease [Acidobacteriota bacterium]
MSVIRLRRAAACREPGADSWALGQTLCPALLSPPLALRACAEAVLVPRVSINFIRVGTELFTHGDDFEIAAAHVLANRLLEPARVRIDIAAELGIPLAEAGDFPWIESAEHARELRDTFGLGSEAIDVFWVKTWAGPTIGRGPIFGRCPDHELGASGCVIALEAVIDGTAQVLAHEIGHYLGLLHDDSSSNLMYESVPNGGRLTPEQGASLRRHCTVEWTCA